MRGAHCVGQAPMPTGFSEEDMCRESAQKVLPAEKQPDGKTLGRRSAIPFSRQTFLGGNRINWHLASAPRYGSVPARKRLRRRL